ncbi:unnamed protein product [Trifolium pratense]|uniref:Uncharacterized protein n=1 Tax=Trifolium pratense TaxID=57577 RepID=A0ACB0LNF0_TRIPR|nr:unnamed protein product [Trifolium pratense]
MDGWMLDLTLFHRKSISDLTQQIGLQQPYTTMDSSPGYYELELTLHPEIIFLSASYSICVLDVFLQVLHYFVINNKNDNPSEVSDDVNAEPSIGSEVVIAQKSLPDPVSVHNDSPVVLTIVNLNAGDTCSCSQKNQF